MKPGFADYPVMIDVDEAAPRFREADVGVGRQVGGWFQAEDATVAFECGFVLVTVVCILIGAAMVWLVVERPIRDLAAESLPVIARAAEVKTPDRVGSVAWRNTMAGVPVSRLIKPLNVQSDDRARGRSCALVHALDHFTAQ